jgi:hypothetical protein
MLFTRRFIKDLSFSVVFVLFIYAITHNPITHPTPKPKSGNWSIQLMQQPLLFGLAGHNYLVLRDDNGTIKKEIHGLATDVGTHTWKYVGIKQSDLLHVWEFNGPHFYLAEKNFPGIILHEGDMDDVMDVWGKGESCIEPINNLHLSYPPLGVTLKGDTENSNSVAYTVTLCMGLDQEHLGLITPGDRKNLLESVPGK